jgi:hypothetical protein
MIEATLADLRQSELVHQWRDVVHLVDARKKREVGFFIPAQLADQFSAFLQQQQQNQQRNLLLRVANAQHRDPIDEIGVDDGIV